VRRKYDQCECRKRARQQNQVRDAAMDFFARFDQGAARIHASLKAISYLTFDTLDNVSFEVADITKPWPCESESYDLIVCNLVLEHIRDLSLIFAEAFRVLVAPGRFFLCELHPTRQYAGKQANFQRNGKMTPIKAFVHHLTDFTDAANDCGFSLQSMKEWWHEEDWNKPPRLVSFMFEKRST